MRIIGFKNVDFKTKEGDQIKGVSLFCLTEEEGVEGTACERVFVTDQKANGWKPTVGEEIEVVYNKYGKVDRVIVMKKAA